jgi:hypothetical protein
MSSQSMNINSNQPSAPFGHYNNTWDEVFDIRSQFSSFIVTALKAIYGTSADSSSRTQFKQFKNYVLEHDLTLYWSMAPGVDATHYSFVNGPFNSHSHLLVCSGPAIDIPLNHTKDSFLRLVMESVGYISSNSMQDNFLCYKADMQHLHGYQKSRWARNCILRVILPSHRQLTGTRPQLMTNEQPRAQTSASPQPVTSQKVAFDAQTTTSPTEQDDNLPQFTVLREKTNSLFVKLNTHDSMPEVYDCSAIYHRPLYLKFDPISNEFGYWIGRDSFIANNLI